MRISIFFTVIFSLWVLFVAISSSAKAQERWQNYLDFGIDNTTLINDGNGTNSSLTNPYIGFNLFSPALFHHDEPRTVNDLRMVLNTGYTVKGGAFASPAYKHRFHYGQVTIKPTVMLFDAFNVFAGVQGAYLGLSSRDGAENVDNEDLMVTDPKPFEVAGQLGMGAPLSQKFRLYLRYQRSITPVEGSISHAGFRIGVNYLLSKPEKGNIQTSNGNIEKEKQEKSKNTQAEKHIKRLKEGVLLVRLSSRRKQIQSLEKNGRSEKARELKEQVKKRHRKIIDAFEEAYTFSDVGFFLDSQTPELLNENWEKALLETGNKVSSKNMAQNPDHFYIADAGESYIKQEEQTFKGLVIRDKNLEYIQPPFPNKIANLDGLFFLDLNRSPKELVEKLNTKLNSYFREVVN